MGEGEWKTSIKLGGTLADTPRAGVTRSAPLSGPQARVAGSAQPQAFQWR
jgi:hypothetical protein